MWTKLRRRRLRSALFSVKWRRIIESDCPFYERLSEADRSEIEGHVQVFLAEKRFEGCDGLEVIEEMKVCIAAYACLLLLHRQSDYYPYCKTILVYPDSFVVPIKQSIGVGVIQERDENRAGESWEQGAVVVAWNETCQGNCNPGGGYNVVVHEFAHQLDYENGLADGCPLLAADQYRAEQKKRYARWKEVMQTEYRRLCGQVQKGETSVLRDYGATNPVEFFAVATECFFSKPQAMRASLPQSTRN